MVSKQKYPHAWGILTNLHDISQTIEDNMNNLKNNSNEISIKISIPLPKENIKKIFNQ